MKELAVRVPTGRVVLDGDLIVPSHAAGIVLFAHGSGSSRHSPRNRFVAEALQKEGMGTLLMDLLTEDEERIDVTTAELRFDIGLLAERLVAAIEWLGDTDDTSELDIGIFGASTGAAAALVAAAQLPERVHAVVSRGGRPDLAGDSLGKVRAPTLLIVGGADTTVLEMNRDAMSQMTCGVKLEIVPAASHLFEEPGALEQVAQLAGDFLVARFTA